MEFFENISLLFSIAYLVLLLFYLTWFKLVVLKLGEFLKLIGLPFSYVQTKIINYKLYNKKKNCV